MDAQVKMKVDLLGKAEHAVVSKVQKTNLLNGKEDNAEEHPSKKEKQFVDLQRKLKASLASRKMLMSKVKEKEESIHQHEELNKSLAEEKNQLELKLNESLDSSRVVDESEQFQEEIASLKKQLEIHETRAEEASAESRNLTDQLAVLKSNHEEDLQVKIQEILQLENSISLLQAELQSQKTLADEQISELNKSLAEKKNQLELKINESDLNSSRIVDESEQFQEEIASLKKQLEIHETRAEEASAESRNLTDQLAVLKSNHEEDFQVKIQEILQLENTIFLLQAELQSQKTLADEQITALNQSIDDLKTQHNCITGELLEVKEQLQTKCGEMESLQIDVSQLNNSQDDVEKLRQNIEQLSSENRLLETNLEEIQAQREVMQKELEQFKNNDIKLGDITEQLNDMHAKLMASTLEREKEKSVFEHRLQREIEERKELVQVLQAQIEEDLSHSKQLEGQLKVTVDERDALKFGLDEAQDKLLSINEKMLSKDHEYEVKVKELEEKIIELSSTEHHQREELTREQLQKSASTDEKVNQLQRKLKAALMSRKELISNSKKHEEEMSAKEEMVKELNFKINFINSSLEQKDLEINRLHDAINQINIDNSNLRKQIEENKMVSEQLRVNHEKVHELQTEVTTLETCNKDLNEMVSSMEQRIGKLDKTLRERSESLRSAQKCIRKLETTIGQGEASSNEFGALKEQLHQFEEKCEELELKCDKLDGERQEKIAMLDQLTSEFETETLAKEDLLVRCKGLKNMLYQQQSGHTAVVVDGALPAEPDHESLSDNPAEQDHESLSDNYEMLLRKHEALTSKCEELDTRILALKDENTSLLGLNHDLSDANKQFTEEVEKLKQHANDLKSNFEKQQSEIRDVKVTNGNLQMNIEENGDLKDMTLIVEELRATEETLKNEIEELGGEKKELESLKKRYAALQKDCDYLNGALQREKVSYEQVLKRLERENLLIKEKFNEEIKSKAIESSKHHMEANHQASTMDQKISETKRKLEESTVEVDDLKMKIFDLEDQKEVECSRLKEEVDIMKEQIEQLKIESSHFQV